jgi:hypothetical protein
MGAKTGTGKNFAHHVLEASNAVRGQNPCLSPFLLSSVLRNIDLVPQLVEIVNHRWWIFSTICGIIKPGSEQ